MPISEDYKNVSIRYEAHAELQELARQIAAREHKRITLTDALLMVIEHYQNTVLNQAGN